MNQLLIQSDTEALQGLQIANQEIFIRSKRLNKGILINTTIIENGQIKRYGKKRGII